VIRLRRLIRLGISTAVSEKRGIATIAVGDGFSGFGTKASRVAATAWQAMADLKRSPTHVLILAIFLLIGLFLRVEQAVRNPHLAHPDEVFQTEEPAHRLAYGYGVITWEWRLGIRSWVFPAFLACVMRETSWLGAGATGYLFGIVAVLSLISLVVVWFGFAWAKQASGVDAAIIAAGACATWYELVNFAPRALTEVVATHALLAGLYLGVWGEELPKWKRLFAAGLCCGVSLSLRIQLTPAIAFAVFYFCRSGWRKRLIPLGVGLMVPILVFGVVDMLTWSYPLQSFVRYFWVNAVERRSELYGTEPWYWYVVILLDRLGPMAVLALVGVRRSPFLGWLALIILAFHSSLSHKEIRFLYPLVPIVITLASLGIVEVADVFYALWRPTPSVRMVVVLVGLSLCVLASSVLAKRFQWFPSVDTFDRLSRDKTVCGVGLYGIPWFTTGGYTHLHQAVPISLVPPDESPFGEESQSFNVLVANDVVASPSASFQLVGCSDGACLYRRQGSCTPRQGLEINEVLRRTGN